MTISEDKKTIILDIPLGTEVFTYDTDCNNTCYRSDNDKMHENVPEWLREKVEELGCGCNQDAPCHVLYKGVRHETLTLINCSEILPLLNKKWFLTGKEAAEAGISHVMAHRKILKNNDIPFGEHDAHLIKQDYLAGVKTPESVALGRIIDKNA